MRRTERLSLYKKLLKAYTEKRYGNYGITSYGLCYAIREVSGYTTRLKFLPELKATKPKRTYYGSYWYEEGQTKGRIACIKKAIDMCMQKKFIGRQK